MIEWRILILLIINTNSKESFGLQPILPDETIGLTAVRPSVRLSVVSMITNILNENKNQGPATTQKVLKLG